MAAAFARAVNGLRMPGLVRLLSLAGRLGFAVTLALVALAATRWSPIDAEPPIDVRALPLAGPALAFGVLAALTGRERRPGPWRRVALALVAAAAGPGGRRGAGAGLPACRPRCPARRGRSGRPRAGGRST